MRKYKVAAWEEYVFELCAIRDRLLFYDPEHPVYMALNIVSPVMSVDHEAYIRQVIAEYGMVEEL